MTIPKISARGGDDNVIVSMGPDVCWTPRGKTKVAVPYTSIAFLRTAFRLSPNANINGIPDFQLNSRCATSKGHKPGTEKGIKEHGYQGVAHAQEGASFTFSATFSTVSHRDPAWINQPIEGRKEPHKSKAGENV